MNFNQKEINDLLKQGESRYVEFKSKEFRAESIVKEMVVFSNSQGCVILIGVSDKGEVEGISGTRPGFRLGQAEI